MSRSLARVRSESTVADFGKAGDAGALGHYDNPEFYWRSYARRRHDIAYYVGLARPLGRVLEYGVGNGRIALPLARAGVEVVGVDLSGPMLTDLHARLEREPERVRSRVRAVRGDMRRAMLGERFDLVIAPFNALLHLYTRDDVELFLARVRAHLRPHGEFVFDISVPTAHDLARRPARAYGCPTVRDPASGDRLRYQERFEYDHARQLLLVWAEFASPRRGVEWRIPLTQRQFFPCEMEALLHYGGFREIRQVVDFGRGGSSSAPDSLVFHCRARARQRGESS